MLSIVIQLQEQLELLEEEIELAANALPEVDILKTMPGVGDKLAAAILSEVGDVKQFHSPKQLVAYAGLDPGVFSSVWTAGEQRRSKRVLLKEAWRSWIYFRSIDCFFRKSSRLPLGPNR
ncbi:hypothetical protein PC115_g24281 [Phytophthora cactorum]|uniref:Transposase IS116/IS110/IS902 C-terminal domain-containing protein n=1 Tax=Phytophthora cactorum TaxID=29920 RepID=A0A8T1AB43_9STRA|nr:hypothetical protein PC115_g24281 [Phytophthora cactorum]